MRFATLLAFTLTSVVYAAAFAIPLSDVVSTDVADKHPPSALPSRDYVPNHEVRDTVDVLDRRYYAFESRDDSDESGAIQDDGDAEILKHHLTRRGPGDEANHLGLYQYDNQGRPYWVPVKKPTSSVIQTQPDASRPQRQGTWQSQGYQQGPPPPGNWQATAPESNYYGQPNPAHQAPAGHYGGQPQDQSRQRRPSMLYNSPATYHQQPAAGAPGASYGHTQAGGGTYGHAQPGARQRRPSTSNNGPVIPPPPPSAHGYGSGPVIPPYAPLTHPSHPPPPGEPPVIPGSQYTQSRSKSKNRGGSTRH
ncbi:hypothetical protein K474DRAFT_1711175 [Panus rudis PR-1116 ss-1]|nr:hypothetical protein K474DRAFT_1711175 [Panus rudis PR-1116 ss-1]